MTASTENYRTRSEFAGIRASGRSVRTPMAVSCEMKDGLIRSARIYLMVNVLVAPDHRLTSRRARSRPAHLRSHYRANRRMPYASCCFMA